MSAKPGCQYTPLLPADTTHGPEIRLLYLHPSQDSAADLHCHLKPVTLQDNGLNYPVHLLPDSHSLKLGRRHSDNGGEQYSALSYAWGEDDPSIDMICGSGSLKITENLEAALRQLRQPDVPAVLWVDAVCIDQTNFKERSEQVRIMGRIFNQAEKVLVWLGPQAKVRDDEICIQVFNNIAALIDQQIFLPLSAEDRDVTVHRSDREVEALLVLLTAGPEPLLDRFFHRRWFSRRWVIQELVLAHDAIVVCGQSSILWHHFEAVLSELHHRFDCYVTATCSSEVQATIKSLHRSRRAGMKPHWQDELSSDNRAPIDILCQYSNYDSRDERDRVFALSGIIKAERAGCDDPVWDTGISYLSSVEEVYTALAKLQVHAYPRDLRILLAAALFRDPDSNHPKLPSWVPDWRYLPQNKPLKFIDHMNHARKHFTPLVAPDALTCIDNDHLLISVGNLFLVEKVFQLFGQEVQEEGSLTFVFESALRNLRRAYSTVGMSSHPSKESLIEKSRPHFNTALLGILKSVGGLEPRQVDELENWLEHEDTTQELCHELVIRMQQLLRGRSIIMTNTNHIALSPGKARPGDVICCARALTLCLREVNPGSYVLLGDALICHKHFLLDPTKPRSELFSILYGERGHQDRDAVIKII